MIGKELLKKVINKQFEMIKVDFSYDLIPQDSIIEVNKKKLFWYDFYKFEDEPQYKEWRDWINKLVNEKDANYIDLRWGMTYRYKKEGLLF